MYDHTDPTAWIAIANVERERRNHKQNKAKHKEPVHYEPRPPVDAQKVMASKNKKIRVNMAWYFVAEMERQIKNERVREEVLRQRTMAQDEGGSPQT